MAVNLETEEAGVRPPPVVAGEHELGAPLLSGASLSTGVSPQHIVLDTDQPTVKADVTERQAVEVRPMRYVLAIGIILAILAMVVIWMMVR